jgi:hypothetical protein
MSNNQSNFSTQVKSLCEEAPTQVSQATEGDTASVPLQISSPDWSRASTVSVSSSGPSAAPSVSQFYSLNFTIPCKWRPSIMKAIKEEKLTPDIRNEIVRDVVTHMYGYMEKPTTSFCKFVAQRLILQHKFMRDSKGTGYVSLKKEIT